MMNVRHSTQHAGHTVASSCEPAAGDCGALVCLERPQFGCGQLLTDADLNQVVGWAGDRFKLARFRDGWGVVCGLAVHCDPYCPSGVMVMPGYAIDCCGHDLVVCEADEHARLDLAGECQLSQEGCGEGWPIGEGSYIAAWSEPSMAYAGAGQGDSSGRGEGGQQAEATVGEQGSAGQAAELCVVDVFVRYAEVDSGFQPTIGRNGCGSNGQQCVPTRIRSSYTLVARRAESRLDPWTIEANRWWYGYQACGDVIQQFQASFGDILSQGKESAVKDNWPALRRWLLRWIQERPVALLCLARDLICAMPETAAGEAVRPEVWAWSRRIAPYVSSMVGQSQAQAEGEPAVAGGESLGNQIQAILALLFLDCRLSSAQCDCHVCADEGDVRLARVYLYRSQDAFGRASVQVAAIDPFAPNRRLISHTCWPAPPGCINLGQLIGQRWEVARRQLTDWGIEASAQAGNVVSGMTASTQAADGSRIGVMRWMDTPFVCLDGCDPVAAAAAGPGLAGPPSLRAPIVAQVVNLESLQPGLGCRVVGFQQGQVKLEQEVVEAPVVDEADMVAVAAVADAAAAARSSGKRPSRRRNMPANADPAA